MKRILDPSFGAGLVTPKRRAQVAGVLLLTGSVFFWACWALMPMPGTADAAFILDAVAATRFEVWLSCIVQLLSAAAWAAALVLAPGPSDTRGQLAWWLGGALLAIGMCVNAADAIYHLVAYELTAVAVPADVALAVMTRFQGPDLVLLLPGVGAFALGLGLYAIAAVQAELVPRASLLFFVAALVAIGGRLLLPGDLAPRIAALLVLACAVAPISWLGWVLFKRPGTLSTPRR